MLHSIDYSNVTYELLMEKLLKEQIRLQDATHYRKDTAKQAIQVVKEQQNPIVYLSESNVISWMERQFPEFDNEKVRDIAKYIRVIVKDIALQETMPISMRNRI